MTKLSQALGARLRELRRDAELSQADIARRMRSERAIVARMERGKHTLTLQTLQGYARALELDLLDVLAPVDIEELLDSPAKQRSDG